MEAEQKEKTTNPIGGCVASVVRYSYCTVQVVSIEKTRCFYVVL